MGRGRRTHSIGQGLQALARAIQQEGITPGTEVPRGAFDDILMVGADISPKTVEDYIRRGKAEGYWTVNAAHGKGGRGSVVFYGEAT